MDPVARRRKKDLEAQRLRDVPPAQTFRNGLDLMAFSRRVAEAADDARL